MVKAYIITGLGIGCHEEAAHAYRKAGAETEFVHARQLLSGERGLSGAQILNFPGGFLHGDILGAGMCAANEFAHAADGRQRLKDSLIAFAENGNVVYGQCNGFQLLVKLGLLPGIGGDCSRQTATLTYNDCGSYRVAPVLHAVDKPHFAFEGINEAWLWCRHGEGKLQFHSGHGLVTPEEGERNREITNQRHVLLRYAHPATHQPTEEFPHNPNGSADGIAGLVNSNGNIFGHMAHPEVGVYDSRDPRFFALKDAWRRRGIKAGDISDRMLEGIALEIFRNIVRHFA